MTRRAGKKPASLAGAAQPSTLLGRRALVLSLAAMGLTSASAEACRAASAPPGPLAPGVPAGTTAARGEAGGAGASGTDAGSRTLGTRVELHSWFDLPVEDSRSRELSGIAWDEPAWTLWGVQDETANIVALKPDRDLRKWTFGSTITLKMTFPLDLEGIAVTPDGFIVASEKGPRVLEVDRQGKLRKDIELPAHFAKARDNKSLESLTVSPDGRYLFTTSEAALRCDGDSPTLAKGSRLRILRITLATGENAEHAYATDPLPHDAGDYGVADLVALSADELLVLERGWSRGVGNTARIYRVNLADPTTSCLTVPELGEGAPVLPKKLLVDLSKLPARGFPAAKQQQDTPLLDNYEGMALGPRLPDGRDILFLISDDNGRSDQYARVLVLSVKR